MSPAGRGVAYLFWERIERERYARGMTQRDLVEQTGIPASTINNLKKSTRPPQPRIVHALADVLGVDRDEAAQLAGQIQSDTLPDPDDDFDDIDLEIEMIRASDLPRAVKESLIREAMRYRDRQAADRKAIRDRQAKERQEQVKTWIDIARSTQPAT